MKQSLIILFAIVVLAFSACKKDQDGPGEVYGNWKLKETLADPGDGSGKYIKVEEDKFLKLDRSGQVSGDVLPSYTKFKLVDSTRIEFSGNTAAEKVIYYFKVSEKSLTLNPPCIEGCGLRFERK